MKIIKLKAENVKRLKAVEITPDGAIVRITGRNEQGKTSLLDAIWWALGGTKNIQQKPIRKGALEASVELDLGKYIVSRRWTHKGSYLHVRQRDETSPTPVPVSSPQDLLDGMLSKVAFDPLSFMRLKAGPQAELLRSIAGLDTSKADKQIAELSTERTLVGRSMLSTPLSAMPDPGPPKSVDEATAALERAQEAQRGLEDARRVLADVSKTLSEARDEESRLAAELEIAHTRVSRWTVNEGDAKLQVENKLAAPDTAGLREEISAAAEHNLAVASYRQHKKADEADQKVRETYAMASTRLMRLRREREATILGVDMPVDGLGFDDAGGVTFDGIPLDQASGAQKLRISMEIAMASQPDLRIIRITDGSLLDSQSLEIIRQSSGGEGLPGLDRIGRRDRQNRHRDRGRSDRGRQHREQDRETKSRVRRKKRRKKHNHHLKSETTPRRTQNGTTSN